MNVYLKENGDQLPTDVVLKWVLRSDLVPVPRSLEFTVKLVDDLENRLAKGSSVWSGRDNLRFEIVKADRAPSLGQVQGHSQQQAMKITALLHNCAAIAKPLAGAVISGGSSFGGLYKACGAYTNIANDFVVPRFACFKGKIPSFAFAQILQEEGAGLVLRNGGISVMRLADMARQRPIDDLGYVDSSAKISSEFLEMQDIPSFYSVDDKAAIVTGQMGQTRSVAFIPRADVRQLRNASCVLVRNKTTDSAICQHINAGDVLRVAGENLVVITAAHAAESLEGAMESRSRLWLGSVVNAL